MAWRGRRQVVVRASVLAAAGMSLIAVTYGLARFAYGLFLPELRSEFELDGATAGAIAASSYLGYCVSILAATLLTPRWGARRIAVIAGLAAVAGTALIAAAPTTAVLVAAAAFGAVGQAVGAPLIGIVADITSQPTAFLTAAAAAVAAVALRPAAATAASGR
jgi:MFS family permease